VKERKLNDEEGLDFVNGVQTLDLRCGVSSLMNVYSATLRWLVVLRLDFLLMVSEDSTPNVVVFSLTNVYSTAKTEIKTSP